MGDVINLRQARKRRDKTAASRLAEQNRAKFGRTKAERQAQQAEAERLTRQVDGARRDLSGETENGSPENVHG